jgi:isocitrate dehydrogenase kinase/phosphatase
MPDGQESIAPIGDPHAARARRAAGEMLAGFERYRRRFMDVTRRAPRRQTERDWRGAQADAGERLDLYESEVNRTVADLDRALGDHFHCRACWIAMKSEHAALAAGRPDQELARTFFSSATRRVFATVGVDSEIEFTEPVPAGAEAESPPPYTSHPHRGETAPLIRDVFAAHPVGAPYLRLDDDASAIARRIDDAWRAAWGEQAIDAIDVLHAVFYRNKGAYLVGRIRGGRRLMPLVVALVNEGGRIAADAVLLTVDEASIVFSFTRSAFHADVDAPARVIRFLKSIMPAKRVAELYIALGYDKHGKAELYRDLVEHLGRSTDRFEIAPGDAGLVMVVFTLPSYDVVFKLIRDAFGYPKNTSREHVIGRYQLVFKHDRAGRLIDTQEFKHLAIPRHRVSDALLAELLGAAGRSVTVEGDRVVLHHVYTERRVTPLNLYLREAAEDAAADAVTDFGRAIKDLAATNIFPGDMLLKNFGVTRHGRVVFYDYDEICLLTECSFRAMPEPRTAEEEMAAEPWFYVGPHDIFPAELGTFMGLYGPLRHVFLTAHGELLGPEFWRGMQALHGAGEIIDIFPYRPERRLRALPA